MWLNVSKQQQKNRKETKKKKESTSCVSEAKNSRSEKGIKSKRPQKQRFCQSQNWDLCLQDGDDYVNWNVSVSFISPFFFVAV